MITVLVVDDDFRVAGVHAGFVEQTDGFTVVGTARTLAEARARIRELAPELVLLDVYLPDGSGLGLLVGLAADAIVLSAASDTDSVRAALRGGAVNFLIKPFTRRQLADRLTAYARYRSLLAASTVDQDTIDRALRALREGDRATGGGPSSVTAKLVAERVREADGALSAAEIAAALGIARATAQRYLTALTESGTVHMGLRYGATGRPEHEYSWPG